MREGVVAAAAPEQATINRWTSGTGFIFATAGAAIGLGSLWRFPYVAGSNGGGAFVILFILFMVVLGVPLMIAEMTIGLRGHGSVVGSMSRLIAAQRVSPAWNTIGALSLVIPFFGLSYYSVVAGWCADYTRQALVVGFDGIQAPVARQLFDSLLGSTIRQGLFQFCFLLTTATVVALGVQRGIEVVSRIKMTALFVILIGLVIYNAVTVGLGPGLSFLLKPDFSAITSTSVLIALGQAMFSTAIGAGVLMTYSAYLPPDVSIPKSAVVVAGTGIVAALMVGLAIFPIVLANGLKPEEGPNLIFVTLPVAFGSMPGGRIISMLFFGLTTLAAFTTAVGMLEPITAWICEATRLRRPFVAFGSTGVIWLVGLPSLLSFSVLKNVHPLSGIPGLAEKTVFGILDFGIAGILQPINALLIALFAAWALRHVLTKEESGVPHQLFRMWRIFVGIFAPAAILIILLDNFTH